MSKRIIHPAKYFFISIRLKTKLIIMGFLIGSCFLYPQSHNPGMDCFMCHTEFSMAGTVFSDSNTTSVMPKVEVTLLRSDGSVLEAGETNQFGNIAFPLIPDGNYIMKIGEVKSRTWHQLPDQKSCNSCHITGGNGSQSKLYRFTETHSEIPEDNDCTHCHHFPQTKFYDELKTPGVLNTSHILNILPGSWVIFNNQTYEFNPGEYSISTVRPDIFAPGYFSVFDVIIAVAERNGMQVEYYYDEECKTHFITSVNQHQDDFWYRFAYHAPDLGDLNKQNATRWDELLWRPGLSIRLTTGENLAELKTEFAEEIERETNLGNVIPSLIFMINPSDFEGNPSGSGRITVTREYNDIHITPHDLRATGYPSHYSKPFQPGVITSIDIPLSLMDMGLLNAVTNVFYTNFAGNYIDSYYVVELGFPDSGSVHASGRQGFVYLTNNGAPNNLPNNADFQFHITADIAVLHAPDFTLWRWLELGNPYYEDEYNPTGVEQYNNSVLEDYESISRGFNLYAPYPNPFNGAVKLRFNIFMPGNVNISVFDILGQKVAELYNGYISNIGNQEVNWNPGSVPSGTYFIVMQHEKNLQVRSVAYAK